jgi:hypothetical protein
MEENKRISEEKVSGVAGGETITLGPEEWRDLVIENLKTRGFCVACQNRVFHVNKNSDLSLEEQFTMQHLKICQPYLTYYHEIGGTKPY